MPHSPESNLDTLQRWLDSPACEGPGHTQQAAPRQASEGEGVRNPSSRVVPRPCLGCQTRARSLGILWCSEPRRLPCPSHSCSASPRDLPRLAGHQGAHPCLPPSLGPKALHEFETCSDKAIRKGPRRPCGLAWCPGMVASQGISCEAELDGFLHQALLCPTAGHSGL